MTSPSTTAYAIALGSNLGDRLTTLRQATRLLNELAGSLLAVSAPYKTAPMYVTDQPEFLNAAALLRSPLAPEPLLAALLDIERQLGRAREGATRFGPRTLDLDLLMGEGLVYTSAALTLPHPRMLERRFVLAPLAEIAGHWVHPTSQQTIQALLDCCPATNSPEQLLLSPLW